MTPEEHLTRRILALCALTGSICAALFAAFGGRGSWLSALAGAALGATNFALMVALCRTAFDPLAANWKRLLAGLALSTKSAAVLGLVAWLFFARRVQPIAFLTGLMMLLVSIVLAVLSRGGGNDEERS